MKIGIILTILIYNNPLYNSLFFSLQVSRSVNEEKCLDVPLVPFTAERVFPLLLYNFK